jgi:hypothetical protein
MSVKIQNNLDIIIYFGIDYEEKLPIMDKEYQDLTKEAKEYTLRLSEIYENFQDKLYKITPPCIIVVNEGFVVSIEKNGVTKRLEEYKPKEEKKEEEKPKEEEEISNGEEFPELKSKKEIKLISELLKENESYVFLNNNYSKCYKCIEKKEETFEVVLVDPTIKLKENEEEIKIPINIFENKISPFIEINCKFVLFDNRILPKKYLININNNFTTILKQITDSFKHFIGGDNYRVIYRGEDISIKEIDIKIFQKITKKQKNNSLLNIGINEIEDFTGDSFILQSEKGKNEEIEKSEIQLEQNSDDKKLIKENPEEKKKESSLKEKLLEAKNLYEIGFDFLNDNFIFLFPDPQFKLCNFHNYQTYWYEARNCSIINVFAFDKDITIKNLNIAGSTGTITYLKLTIYESFFDKKPYLDKDGNFEKSEKLKETSIWTKQKQIFETEKIILNCLYRNSSDELKNINDYYTFVETTNLKMDKDKLYGFVFEFGPNTEYNYLYYNSKDSKCQEYNGELNISYLTSKDSYCFLNGFNYKFNMD